ncbi:unnamed protein product [Ceratitis capitata]|uniref:(Mediterranean fruit fly) hypothetical protein n=1 Tax=Ceratitis capitata TaxID=7213 RepID=A0A811VGF9_CERCA|nr:unnamed protein product [Ceratitis capitata]
MYKHLRHYKQSKTAPTNELRHQVDYLRPSGDSSCTLGTHQFLNISTNVFMCTLLVETTTKALAHINSRISKRQTLQVGQNTLDFFIGAGTGAGISVRNISNLCILYRKLLFRGSSSRAFGSYHVRPSTRLE